MEKGKFVNDLKENFVVYCCRYFAICLLIWFCWASCSTNKAIEEQKAAENYEFVKDLLVSDDFEVTSTKLKGQLYENRESFLVIYFSRSGKESKSCIIPKEQLDVEKIEAVNIFERTQKRLYISKNPTTDQYKDWICCNKEEE